MEGSQLLLQCADGCGVQIQEERLERHIESCGLHHAGSSCGQQRMPYQQRNRNISQMECRIMIPSL